MRIYGQTMPPVHQYGGGGGGGGPQKLVRALVQWKALVCTRTHTHTCVGVSVWGEGTPSRSSSLGIRHSISQFRARRLFLARKSTRLEASRLIGGTKLDSTQLDSAYRLCGTDSSLIVESIPFAIPARLSSCSHQFSLNPAACTTAAVLPNLAGC